MTFLDSKIDRTIARLSLTIFSCMTLSFISACATSGKTAINQNLNGSYNIDAKAITQLDSNGLLCGQASGTFYVEGNVMSGSVISTNGITLRVESSVTDDRKVVGGFAKGSNTVATFTGSISGTSGGSNWKNNYTVLTQGQLRRFSGLCEK